ncbi:MAG: YhbY family RNA-binding protein [Nanoarchaeota archaeon]|nr:YhbY family RNA-binding protein [Nanoarchaeota archaeon]
MSMIKFQIGKNGITEGVIESLVLAFKNHKQVRITALKSAGRDNLTEMANEIIRRLQGKTEFVYSFRILGFTIILNKAKRVDK